MPVMDTLRLFCDVARLRSVSKAAKAHGVTQSAASQRLSRLEARLGVQLVDRSVRPLALTPAGETLAREGRDIVERYDELERRVSRIRRHEAVGNVTVDAIYSAGIDLLNHVKESFERDHPGVHVTVQYKQPEEVYEAVRADQCDMGIVSYPQTWRDVAVIPLRDERMVVVCAPSHALARRKKIVPSELADHALIAFVPALPVSRAIRRYLRDHGVTPTIAGEFDNIDTIKNAVTVTNDVAILPRRTVMREVSAGTLAAVDLEPRLDRPIGIIHRKRRAFTPAAQAFIDHLLQLAGPDSDPGSE